MSAETAAALARSIESWLSPFLCESVVQATPMPDDVCIAREDLRSELQRVLQDRMVDRIEAPQFFRVVEALAKREGDDAVLSANEANYVTLALTLSPLQFFGPASPADGAEPPSNTPLTMASFSPLLHPIQDTLQFFDPDRVMRLQTLAHLTVAADHIDQVIALAEKYRQTLYVKESGSEGWFTAYRNFVSAENVLGIAEWFTDATLSSAELDGIRNFLSQLYDMRSSLQIFRNNYEVGAVLDNAISTEKFFGSPFAQMAHVEELFGTDNHEHDDSHGTPLLRNYLRGVIGLATQCGATRFAAEFANVADAELDDPYFRRFIESALPAGGMRFLEGPVRSFGNAMVSLDSLLVIAAGGVVGQLAAGSSAGRALAATLQARLGAARYVLPGVPLLTRLPGEAWLGLAGMKLAGNFVVEAGKLVGMEFTGYALGGESGAQFGAKLYLFGLGITSGFADRATQMLTAEALGANVDLLLKGDVSDAALTALDWAEQMTPEQLQLVSVRLAKVGNLRSFRLSRGMDPEVLARRLLLVRSELAQVLNLRAELEGIMLQIAAKQDRVARVLSEHRAFLSDEMIDRADAIVKDVQTRHAQAADGMTPLDALKLEVRLWKRVPRKFDGWLGEARGQINRATRSRARPSSGTTSPQKTVRGPRLVRAPGAAREKQKPWMPAWLRKNAEPAPVAEPTTPVDPLDLLIENPPEKLTTDVMEHASLDCVKVNEVPKILREWYADASIGWRRAFLQRLRSLGGHGPSRWKRIRVFDRHGIILQARVDHFRFFFRQVGNNQYEFFNLVERNALPWK